MRRHPSHPYSRHMQEMQNRHHEKQAESGRWGGSDDDVQGDPAGAAFAHAVEEESPSVERDQPAETPDAGSEKAESAEELKARLEDERLRMAAEMENFKKRLTREYQEQLKFAAEKVLNDLLPSLDNMDLALQYGGSNEACKDMVQGIAMTRKLLDEALKKHGLSQVGQAGEEFDPNIHEAVGFEQNSEYPAGHVARVLQNGYKLNDRLIRPAKVMVNQ